MTRRSQTKDDTERDTAADAATDTAADAAAGTAATGLGARPDSGRAAASRVTSFLVERFPPAPQLVLTTVLFVAATLMSGVLLDASVTGTLGSIEPGAAAMGLLGSLLFIVRLRVYDDVKDADTDRVENPTRPIPRGLVTVRELDVAGAVILVIEGALFAAVGALAFGAWIIAAAWSVLMRVEFFVPTWLERRVATYAISHMVVMGLIYAALLAIGIDARGGDTSLAELLGDPLVLGTMLAATSIGIGFEWGRKFERYHAAHGERAWSLWLLWPCLGAIGFTYLARDTYPVWTTVALAGVTSFGIGAHALAMGQRPRASQDAPAPAPSGKLREAVELLPGVLGLLVYLVLAVGGIVEVAA